MNGAGGDERVNSRPLGVLHSLPCGSNVVLVAAGEAADDGNVAVVTDGVSDFLRDHFNGFEVVLGRRREPSLDDVDAELGELARHVELLLGRHGGAGRLLAVAESGVENADIGRVRNAVGDVRWTTPRRLRLGARNGESEGPVERRVSWRGLRETESKECVVVVFVFVRNGGNEERVADHGGHGEKP